MAIFEVLVLDGLSFSGDPAGTFVLEELAIPAPQARYEWIGTADSEGQALLRGPQHENREITCRIRVPRQASMNLALDQIGAVRDKFAKAERTPGGIAMTWTPADSTRSVTFDVIAGQIENMPIGWGGQDSGWFLRTPVLALKMTAKPYWRGAEVLTATASSSTPFVALEIPNVPGDVPALGRLIGTDTATQSRRHVEWGLESPDTYAAATSLLVDSDDMVVAGFAGTQATTAGAFDPNAVGTNSVSSGLRAAPTAVAGLGNLSHVGGFRVKARVQVSAIGSGDASDARVRLGWKAADGPLSLNDWARPRSGVGQWSEVDLGTILIPRAVTGTHRWTGRIEAMHPSSATLIVDYLILVPVTSGYGVARATPNAQVGAIAASDDFDGLASGTALNARVAPQGGTWATSGSAIDFIGTGGAPFVNVAVSRASNTDAGARRAVLTGSLTDVQVSASTYVTAKTSGGQQQGVIARHVNATNYLTAVVEPAGDGFALDMVVAGATTRLGFASILISNNSWYTVDLVAYASGQVGALLYAGVGKNGAPIAGIFRQRSELATAGALAAGVVGLIDFAPSALAQIRYHDKLAASIPAAEEIALYSGRSIQFRDDSAIRFDSTGVYVGRPNSYRGSRFLVAPGTSRVLLKARRNDVAVGYDDVVTDATQVQVAYTPRGLAVPR